MYTSLIPSCCKLFSILCRSKRSRTSPRSCSLKMPPFTNNRPRLLQRYLKTEFYNSINLFHERRGIKTTNQQVRDDGDPNQTNRQATIFIEGDPTDDKNTENVITLANAETARGTRAIKEAMPLDGTGRSRCGGLQPVFQFERTFSPKRRLLGREVMDQTGWMWIEEM